MKNNVLVINCGSSSLKFSLFDSRNNSTILSGLAEKLLTDAACITLKYQQSRIEERLQAPFDHQSAMQSLVKFLSEHQLVDTICAVGHRVVHGGETYSEPTLIDDNVKQEINKLAGLAPLHNPANLVGIEAAQGAFTKLPHVAVFDTAFHQTMPQKAYLYALPYHLYKQHGIRKYGFHGTSHYFVASQAAKLLDKPLSDTDVISAHLGNGCSITAIRGGKSVDTSLGLTPLAGVAMGTRSGDIDPGIINHLIERLGYSVKQIDNMLNKESGLLGISQLSNDCRELEQAAESGDENAQLALDIFAYRVAKTIAAMTVCFNHLDGIIFTGGIGENSSYVRHLIVEQLSLIGAYLNQQANLTFRFGKQGNIASSGQLPVWVIPTNEEYVIAMQTLAIKQSTKEEL